jgi:hypothetical protein
MMTMAVFAIAVGKAKRKVCFLVERKSKMKRKPGR